MVVVTAAHFGFGDRRVESVVDEGTPASSCEGPFSLLAPLGRSYSSTWGAALSLATMLAMHWPWFLKPSVSH